MKPRADGSPRHHEPTDWHGLEHRLGVNPRRDSNPQQTRHSRLSRSIGEGMMGRLTMARFRSFTLSRDGSNTSAEAPHFITSHRDGPSGSDRGLCASCQDQAYPMDLLPSRCTQRRRRRRFFRYRLPQREVPPAVGESGVRWAVERSGRPCGRLDLRSALPPDPTRAS